MGLGDLIKSGIKTAKTITADLQATITRKAYTGEDTSNGAPQYGTAQSLTVLIEEKRRFLRVDEMGQQIYASTTLTYLAGDITFGVQDEITMPSGKKPRILDVKAFLDKNGAPYMTEIFL